MGRKYNRKILPQFSLVYFASLCVMSMMILFFVDKRMVQYDFWAKDNQKMQPT